MKFQTLLSLLVMPFIASHLCADEPREVPDLEKIRGTWRLLSVKDEGIMRPKEIGRLDLYDTAKLHRIATTGVRTVFRYELDETTTPRRIIMQTDDELVTLVAIYKLEGDRLTVCSSYKPGVVPSDFEVKLKDGNKLMIFKRDLDH